MIRSVNIENFQSHAQTRLEFVDGVNWIVGASDVGKSTVMRAMQWLFENRPGGDAFRSHWGGDTLVQISTDNIGDVLSDVFTRGKGKENYYAVNLCELKAFGQSVPDEITRTLNLDMPINFQRQHDGPFLVASSPGEVARELNRVASLEEIDTTFAAIEKRLRDTARRHQDGEAEQIERQQRLETEFADLDARESSITALEAAQTKISTKRREHDGLRATIEVAEAAKKWAENAARYIPAAAQIERLELVRDQHDKLWDERFRISSLIAAVHLCQTDIDNRKKFVSINLDDLLAMNADIEEKRRELWRLEKAIDNYSTSAQIVELKEAELLVRREAFNAAMPDICPLCEGEIK